jgi:hypothetical protein
MRLRFLCVCFFLPCIAFMHNPLQSYTSEFVAKRERLADYSDQPNVLLIASTGRSGSTMLTTTMEIYAPQYRILKTHLLPSDEEFKGKILFIFSNPDKSAESALHQTMKSALFGAQHFKHVETSDSDWIKKIGQTTNQTIQDNLLAYDALGCFQHLACWLHLNTKPSTPEQAQILAIKYEKLWEPKTIQAIKDFLSLDHLEFPAKTPRGYSPSQLHPKEILFRSKYNLGTADEPRYAAYNDARVLWKVAPAFQYLRISLGETKEND